MCNYITETKARLYDLLNEYAELPNGVEKLHVHKRIVDLEYLLDQAEQVEAAEKENNNDEAN